MRVFMENNDGREQKPSRQENGRHAFGASQLLKSNALRFVVALSPKLQWHLGLSFGHRTWKYIYLYTNCLRQRRYIIFPMSKAPPDKAICQLWLICYSGGALYLINKKRKRKGKKRKRERETKGRERREIEKSTTNLKTSLVRLCLQ